MTLRTKLGLASGAVLAWLGAGLIALGQVKPGLALVLFAAPALPLVYAVRVKGWWASPPTPAQAAAGIAVLAGWAGAAVVLAVL
ncbi:hypothetical protein [Phenylobacterium sp.]|uniref:hypothetical protein n=1 Tax=Phenylobacterium sp. TaxID=1871053 RepID=UPI0025FAF1CE|nr:hypothetical protein [Phenylobacterium sp.]